ncbi:MAG: lipopolysaccharide transport periplasmic protein LptA [Burkholderiales bacterium]|nr:lipopolysaccharide transport periplasmic protein LptA [Burkholderiales bacterium]
MNLKHLFLLASAFLVLAPTVYAETADSEKPIQIYADKFDGDDVKQIAIYTGNVAVHQGTLEIHGTKLVLSIDPKGYRHAVMTPEKGKLVHFKQRRDQRQEGVEEWMSGKGDKLTYNEQTNQLILTNNAEVARSENGVVKDTSAGVQIVYNLTNSTADVKGDKSKGSAGRVSTVIAPRDTGKDNNKKSPVVLQQDKKISQ